MREGFRTYRAISIFAVGTFALYKVIMGGAGMNWTPESIYLMVMIASIVAGLLVSSTILHSAYKSGRLLSAILVALGILVIAVSFGHFVMYPFTGWFLL